MIPDESEARANLYSLLSLVFSREPDRELVARFAEPEMSAALKEMGIEVDFASVSEEQLDQWAREYAYLFLGPGNHIPPFESVHRGARRIKGEFTFGPMLGKHSDQVEELYETYGLGIGSIIKDQPDHIAAELAFMAFLCRKPGTDDAQRDFLRDHLGEWALRFLALVQAAAESTYFKSFAKLTAEFLASEIQELEAVNAT